MTTAMRLSPPRHFCCDDLEYTLALEQHEKQMLTQREYRIRLVQDARDPDDGANFALAFERVFLEPFRARRGLH